MSFPWFAACRVLDFGPCTQILGGRDCMTDGDMLLNLLAHIISPSLVGIARCSTDEYTGLDEMLTNL